MAIQVRRGPYAQYDRTRMMAGELACVTSGDPDTGDGRSLRVAFGGGADKRLATADELAAVGQAAAEAARTASRADVRALFGGAQ